MKLLLVLILLTAVCSVKRMTFEEARDKLVNSLYKTYDINTNSDSTTEKYIKSQKYKSTVYVKTTYYNDLSYHHNYDVPDEVYEQIQYLRFTESSDPFPFYKIDKQVSYNKNDKYYYGAALRNGEILYYIMFQIDATNEFTFKLKEVKKTVCTDTVNGGKDCKTVSEYVPVDISDSLYEQIQERIKNDYLRKIQGYIDQIKKLNGKVLFSFNEGERLGGDGDFGSTIDAELYYNKTTRKTNLIIGELCYTTKKIKTEFGNFSIKGGKDDPLVAFVTDDGYFHLTSRDNGDAKAPQKQKLFDPTGVYPYKYVTTNDYDLIFYDGNNKILGSIKNSAYLKGFDFAWPDWRYFYDRTGKTRFFVQESSIYVYKTTDSGLQNTQLCLDMKKYQLRGGTKSGYLVVDKNGNLKHIGMSLDLVEWEIDTEAKGDGPYSLDLYKYGIVLLNKNKEVYWTTHKDSVEKINTEYQEYLSQI